MFNGENLRNVRMLYGLSRKELADLLEVTEQAIWQYENSTINPRIDMITNFSHFFNVDSKYFINANKFNYVVREESIAYRNVDREQRTKTASEAMYLEFVNDFVCQLNTKFDGISGLINHIVTDTENMRASGASIESIADFVRKKNRIEIKQRFITYG